MSFKWRTLIYFDTNFLRPGNNKNIHYHKFDFYTEFENVKKFVEDNELSDFVRLSIPIIVIEELKKQKIEAYESDIKKLEDIKKKLLRFPHLKDEDISIPSNNDFEYEPYISQIIDDYINSLDMVIIDLPLEESVFEKVIKRAVDKKAPFKKVKSASDGGFKDVIVWESLLNYKDIDDYDKIIFATNDGGFDGNCKAEFSDKCNKHFKIFTATSQIISELENDFADYLENKKIYDFAEEDYFRDYIDEQLKAKKNIMIGNQEYTIKSYEIIDPCISLNASEEEDIENEEIWIVSSVKITYETENGQKEEEELIEIKTLIDYSLELLDTVFNVDLE